jgi:protein-S-isoprenylcysteine O-methyltransferase Ste14
MSGFIFNLVMTLLIFLELTLKFYIMTAHGRPTEAPQPARRLQMVLIGGMFMIWQILCGLQLLTPLLTPWTLFYSEAIRWIGVGMWLFGIILLYLAYNSLGANWALIPTIQQEQTLTQTGLYRWIRHPMYLAYFISSIGFALTAANAISSLSLFLPTLLIYCSRIQKEEQMLLDKFGEPYRRYMERTGRIFPHLGFKRRPAHPSTILPAIKSKNAF